MPYDTHTHKHDDTYWNPSSKITLSAVYDYNFIYSSHEAVKTLGLSFQLF